MPETQSTDLVVSIIPTHTNHDVSRVFTRSWESFVGSFKNAHDASVPKESLPLWSAVSYRDGYQVDENVEAVHALTFDVDKDPIPTRQQIECSLVGMRSVVSTSSSALATAPRWRTVIALSRPVTGEEYRRLWAIVAANLLFPVGHESKNPSRGWYAPRRGVDGYYESFEIPGEPIDVDGLLGTEVPVPLAPAPANVPVDAQTLEAVRRHGAATLLGSAWPEKSRHLAQLALAGALCRDGWPEAEALEFLCDVCRVAGDENRPKRLATIKDTYKRHADGAKFLGWRGLESHVDRGVVRAARDLLNVGAQVMADAVRTLEEPQPAKKRSSLPAFPVRLLPAVLSDFIEAEAERTQTPPDLAAMLVLGCCAAAVAGRYDVEIEQGYVEPLNIFCLAALAPGERKSAVFRSVFAPLIEADKIKALLSKPARAMAESKLELATNLLKDKKKAYAKLSEHAVDQVWDGPRDKGGAVLAKEIEEQAGRVAMLEVPAEPRLLCDDVTPEKLAMLLAEQHGRMCVASAEGTIFQVISGRYSKDGRASFEVFLQGHAGDSLRVDRQSRPSIFVPHPRLTMALAVQPSVVQGLAENKEMRGLGFLARFFYSFPDSRVGSRKIVTLPMSRDVERRYFDCITKLVNLPAPEETDAENVQIPRLQLSPDALSLHRAFRERLEPELNTKLLEIRDWASKLAGGIGRIAAILSIVENGEECPVTSHAMTSAIEIGELYLLPHASHAFDMLEKNEAETDADALWAWIQKVGLSSFVTRDLVRRGPKTLRSNKKRREAAMTNLVDRGHISGSAETGWIVEGS